MILNEFCKFLENELKITLTNEGWEKYFSQKEFLLNKEKYLEYLIKLNNNDPDVIEKGWVVLLKDLDAQIENESIYVPLDYKEFINKLNNDPEFKKYYFL